MPDAPEVGTLRSIAGAVAFLATNPLCWLAPLVAFWLAGRGEED
jgi:hypothetical protein